MITLRFVLLLFFGTFVPLIPFAEEQNLDTSIIEAIVKGDVQATKHLLDAGANVETRVNNSNAEYLPWDQKEITILMLAVKRKQIEIVKALLARGADVNSNSGGVDLESALMLASSDGNIDLINLLLAAGAQVNALDIYDESALLKAAGRSQGIHTDKNLDAVNILLAAGANPNASSYFGETPLISAAKDNNGKIVKALLLAGADPSIKDKSGKTAKDWAEQYNALVAYMILARW